jgi:hypothetical protein
MYRLLVNRDLYKYFSLITNSVTIKYALKKENIFSIVSKFKNLIKIQFLYVYKEGGGCNCGMGGSEGEII